MRLVRIGLEVVLGDRGAAVPVVRAAGTLWVGAEHDHRFGLPEDDELGDDPRTVLEHDLERLVDELCETSFAWAKRLPECPRHPDSHALVLAVLPGVITATCPVGGVVVRSVAW